MHSCLWRASPNTAGYIKTIGRKDKKGEPLAEYAERVAVLSEKLATEYCVIEDWEKAGECLTTSLEIRRLLHGDDDKRVKDIIEKISEIDKNRSTL